MKVREIKIGNSIVEIHDDFVDPDQTESIIKKIGSISFTRTTDKNLKSNKEQRIAI